MSIQLICLEGRDASGKTTVLRLLKERALKQNLGWVFLSEFSQSEVGALIRDILVRQRFFSLHPNRHLVVSETLVLAADLAHQLEMIFPGSVVVADRGILSLIVYQGQRLLDWGAFKDLQSAITYVATLLNPIGIRPHNILLTVGESEMIKRLLSRGEDLPSAGDLTFLRTVEEDMRRFGPHYSTTFQSIDTERPLLEVVEDVYQRISEITNLDGK